MANPDPEAAEHRTGAERDVSLLEIATPVVREWRLILGLPLGFGALAAIVSLVLPAKYTATTSFVPDVTPAASLSPGLAGVAGQLGIPLSGGGASPDFFASVIRSRELLRTLLLSEFTDFENGTPQRQRKLLDLLGVKGKSQDERVNAGTRELAKVTSARVERRTGIVTLSVTGRPPQLVAEVANRMVQQLNDFNLERRQLQSRERRRFVGERLTQAEGELRGAEAQHLRFLQANRRYGESPLLSFEESRLARQVQLRQEVFLTLSREYEEARIAEVRDTPVITTIDPAVPPDRRSFPQRRVIVLISSLFGGMVALALLCLRQYRDRAAQQNLPEYRGFLETVRRAKDEARRLFRRKA